jgi:putative salt-induced outer membrane protein YdiY
LLTLLAVQQHNVPPDEIVKRDGTRLVGVLVSWNRAEVVFRASDGETHRLSPEEIARMSLGGESVKATAAKLPEPSPLPTQAVEKKSPPKIWKGAIDASYAGNRGTTDSDSLVLEFQSERRTEKHRIKLHSRYFYAIKDGSLAANAVSGGARFDRFFSSRSFVFGSGDFESSEVDKIDLRSIYTAGVGYEILASDARHLSVSGGGGYTRESFSGGTSKDFLSGVFNQEYRQRLFGGSELEQRFRYLQDLQEAARFKLRLDLSLRTKLNDFLSFRIGLTDSYDNRPQPNVKRNELLFKTGLGFTF